MTEVKICGITNLEDALAAVELGADFLGFNFFPKSPRHITTEQCAAIVRELKPKYPAVKLVGVFVNSPLEEIEATIELCQLDLAQLHGDEPPELLVTLGGRGYKAFRGIPENIEAYLVGGNVPPAALLDAAVKGTYGGSGMTGDWQATRKLAERHAVFLAGGLTPENVSQAIQEVRPWGVDTASGVEERPGKKDLQKMESFIKAVRQTA
jgi:phosphoribosylanthranilate isomerase